MCKKLMDGDGPGIIEPRSALRLPRGKIVAAVYGVLVKR